MEESQLSQSYLRFSHAGQRRQDGDTEARRGREGTFPMSKPTTLGSFPSRTIAIGRISWSSPLAVPPGTSRTSHKLSFTRQAKQKQKGAQRMLLPSVEGQEGGKWIVIDSGTVIVHALDEKARAYYDLESHWTSEKSTAESCQDLGKAMVKIRRKNNSKKRVQKTTV
ncbi:hypothetical protein Ancab_018992 [Ancistrocladus abbreviatus]